MPVDPEHVDVLIVGAGLSGVGAANHLQAACPWASYAVLESRAAIGGTWDLFRYPGIRSDSDMFTLGYSFRPWTGEKAIADGDSILDYIRAAATETGVAGHIRLNHRVLGAAWSSAEARWHVTGERTDTGEDVELTCNFLVSCTGYYRYDHGYEPHFAGTDRFAGTVVHPQAWPADLDTTGKRIVVIGSGATAVTLVPSLAATAAHVTMLQRSPTYIGSLPARDPVADALRRWLPPSVSGPLVRWLKALGTQAFYQLSRKRPALVKKLIRKRLERALPPGYDIDTHFTPRYDPWDQRFCIVPDGDLFRAIRRGTASVVTDTIDTFTETGIRLKSGQELPADIVVTATGLKMQLLSGVAFDIDGAPVDLAKTMSYKGMMYSDVPNLASAFGYTNASWTLKCDLTCEYVCRLINFMDKRGYAAATPRQTDPTVTEAPWLDFSSGYVQRAIDKLPRQGSKRPWKLYQNYALDLITLRYGAVDDGTMEFKRRAVKKAAA